MNREQCTTYQCQAAGGRQVTLSRQTLYGVSGIGDQAPGKQHDYGCTQEHTCPHRYTSACAVEQLNR